MFKVQILPFPTIELFKKKKNVKVKHAGHIVVNIVTSMKQGSGGFGAVKLYYFIHLIICTHFPIFTILNSKDVAAKGLPL